ncbi:MAG: amidohydrolase [Bacteroidales bacterium]|nr:amidohydrolase [Bacteroidales bacterium]
MKRILLLALAAVLCALPAELGAANRKKAEKAEKEKLSSVGMRYLNDNFTLYHNLSLELHGYAETGYNEFRSSAALIKHLEENGFTVEKGVAGIPTAYVATFGHGKPVIGILTEYDALPGLAQDTVPYQCLPKDAPTTNGHGCGHNMMGTASTAAGIAIAKWLAEGHEGTVKVFGCPAEEGGGGKAYMVREGCFDGVDAVLDWHSGFSNNTNAGRGMANVRVRFEFHGIPSHAAASPEKGRSALDGVEAFNYMMNMMREHVSSDCRIHYIITDGGQAPNVVPEHAEVLYYLRNENREIVRDLLERAVKAAEGAAMGTGTTMEYEIMNGNHEKLPNVHLARLMNDNMQKVGGVILDERERAFAVEIMKNSGVTDTARAFRIMREVVPHTDEVAKTSGSSDVGNVSWVVPCNTLTTATFVPGCGGLHSWQCVATDGTTIGTKALLNCSKVYYLTAYDLFMHPELLKEIKAEFEERRGPDFKYVPLMGDRKPPLDYCKDTRY